MNFIRTKNDLDANVCSLCVKVTHSDDLTKCIDCDEKYCSVCIGEALHDGWCGSCAKIRENFNISSLFELFIFALEKLNLSYEQLKEMHADEKFEKNQSVHDCVTCSQCLICCHCCDECSS